MRQASLQGVSWLEFFGDLFTGNYGLYLLFFGFVCLGIGIPVPMLILFTALGASVRQEALSLAGAITFVFLASTTGDIISYYLFYRRGQPLLDWISNRFQLDPRLVAGIEAGYQKYGVVAIFIFRWIEWGYGQVVWLCGLSRMPFPRFLAAILLALFPWSIAWTYIGISSAALLEQVLRLVPLVFVALILLAGGLGYLYYRYYHLPRAKRHQEQREATE